MDSEKTIRKYILRPWMKTVGLVLTLAAAVCLIMGFYSLGTADNSAAAFYPDDSETGTMAYIDVVGISPWLYKNDSIVYYTAMDAEGYLYTVRLSERQLKQMNAQQEYWLDESEDAAAPAPYRLEGYVKETTASIRSNICDVWQITEAEYARHFGAKYLDATTSVSMESATPGFVLALLFFFSGFIFLLIYWSSSRVAKKCLRRLEELCLTERAAQQLQNTEHHMVIGKNKGLLSQDFLFGRGTGIVVPYSEILWCYQQNRRVNLIPVDSYLMVGTKATAVVAAVDLGGNDSKGIIAQALAIICQRNPNAMAGYTAEASRAFNAIRKEK